MARPKLRPIPTMENLESRLVLSEAAPSAQAQYMLELIQEARTNPPAAAVRATTSLDESTKASVDYYNVDLGSVRQAIASAPAKPPVAWDADLARAAEGHSQDMAKNKFQSHTGSDGSDLGGRLDRAGYDGSGDAENAFAYADSVDHAMRAFMVDWNVAGAGHRENILQTGRDADTASDEVGIGLAEMKRFGFGSKVVTQVFGRDEDPRAKLVGVAYDDRDGDKFYTPGEGLGGVKIELTNRQSGQKAEARTQDAGGYQVPLDPGTYALTAKLGEVVLKQQDVKIGTQNVKLDIVKGQAPAPASTPAPAPTIRFQEIAKATTPAPAPADAPKAEAPKPVAPARVEAPVTKTEPDAPKKDAKPVPAMQVEAKPVATKVETAVILPAVLDQFKGRTIEAPTVLNFTGLKAIGQPGAEATNPSLDQMHITTWTTWKANSNPSKVQG